ncbi:hypothetical protein DM02DRAFT_655563 [Periconia macrospinosa]|uniref:Rhodopsin domain-containing protein n=1 Tax=Periconia macrospinosa TaxID=97972 RepID=A0A2V1DQR1_9PLEO|nr:hypothetical protein DM02DRAFT_655563 [Periconia macrospinosa]
MVDNGRGQVISWYICTVTTVPFVCMRMFARFKKFGRLAVDDYLILLAFCCLIGDLAIQQHMWNLGLGDLSQATQEDFKGIMKMIVPGSILYVSSLWAVKFALVIFYKRLAAVGSRLSMIYNVALGGLAATYLVIFFDILFQCYPYDKRWSTDPKYQCDPKAAKINYWITIFFNIFSDAIIMILPIAMVSRLQMKLKQKLGVASMFALGFFVIISSIVRAYYSHRNETMLTCTVSMVESAIALIIACLPALRSMIIGGSTRGDPSSYGRHYELSSTGARKMTGNRASISGLGSNAHTSSNARSGDPNGSEDSLVTDGMSTLSSEREHHGIKVETTIQTIYGDAIDEQSKAESSKSPV